MKVEQYEKAQELKDRINQLQMIKKIIKSWINKNGEVLQITLIVNGFNSSHSEPFARMLDIKPECTISDIEYILTSIDDIIGILQ